MKNSIFGFSRKEALGFAGFFILSISLMIFSTVRLISKYYNHSTYTYSEIKKYSHDLWSLQDITLYAVNIQRGSLNLIIYGNNPKEIEIVKAGIQKNRDSLSTKLMQFDDVNQLEEQLRLSILKAGFNYLDLNSIFIKMVDDTIKKETSAAYNANVMRPALRKFTDLTSETGKLIAHQIQKTTVDGLNILYQYEFWILALVLLPYFYFLFRFLHLVVKMILWDSAS